MTNPEFSQPLPIPAFVRAFTGTQPELTPHEQLDVAERFADFTHDVLLNHVEEVVTRESGHGEIPRNQVELVRPDIGGVWVIKAMEQAHAAYSEADEAHRMPQAGIELEFVDSNQEERHGYQYKLLDGVVTRLDFDDLAVEPGDGEYESVFDEDAAREARRYDQPIDTAELVGLQDFVATAEPMRPPYRG